MKSFSNLLIIIAAIVLLGCSKKEKLKQNFIGEWQGKYTEYVTRGDSTSIHNHWPFDMVINEDGSGNYGVDRGILWDWDEENNTMTLGYLDTAGTIYLTETYDILENTDDSQHWSRKFAGRLIQNNIDPPYRLPTERVYLLWR